MNAMDETHPITIFAAGFVLFAIEATANLVLLVWVLLESMLDYCGVHHS